MIIYTHTEVYISQCTVQHALVELYVCVPFAINEHTLNIMQMLQPSSSFIWQLPLLVWMVCL